MLLLLAALLVAMISSGAVPNMAVEALGACARLDLPVERVAPRPAAYDAFCQSHPGQCDMAGESVIELNVRILQALTKTNREVNAEIRFADDPEWQGNEEEWSYPVSGHGDCEDFALEKRRRLVAWGLPRASMSMAVVYHKAFMCPHALLLVETTAGTLALDNLDSAIHCWDKAPYNYESRERPDGQWDRFDQSLWQWFPR